MPEHGPEINKILHAELYSIKVSLFSFYKQTVNQRGTHTRKTLIKTAVEMNGRFSIQSDVGNKIFALMMVTVLGTLMLISVKIIIPFYLFVCITIGYYWLSHSFIIRLHENGFTISRFFSNTHALAEFPFELIECVEIRMSQSRGGNAIIFRFLNNIKPGKIVFIYSGNLPVKALRFLKDKQVNIITKGDLPEAI